MRITFIGSGELGVPTLRKLVGKHEIIDVFTQPDRPAGRGYKLKVTPIKEVAGELSLSIRQPENINSEEVLKYIKESNPDVIVLAAYGKILSSKLLKIPRLGSVNLHASLLPKYRGAAPIHWAIIKGEKVTGVTTFLMDEGMDTGPLLLQREVAIDEEDTVDSLGEKLAQVGADLVMETLEGLERGTLTPRPQDNSQATYAPKLKREDGKINWSKDAKEIFNFIRGTNPFPGAFTFYENKRLKVHKSCVTKGEFKGEAGEVVDVSKFVVKAGKGALELLEVQPEGKKVMSGADFIHGYRVKVGKRFE
jgi:methionyl-tRNA formyltransferase